MGEIAPSFFSMKPTGQKEERRFNMALVNCPDCGREISTSARSCAYCGCLMKEEPTETKSLKEELTYPYVCTCCGSKISERAKRVYIRKGGFSGGLWFVLLGLTVIPILWSLISYLSAVTQPTFIMAIIIGLFVVPIAILSVAEGIYRSLRGDSTQCPVCGNFNSLIPIASPRGRQLIRDANCICSDDKSIDGCV